MNKFMKGLILILMMFGHNYVINQAQSLQTQIQSIHKVTVPQFNLLYSIPSAVSIIFIIPLGILYDRYSLKILMMGALFLLGGQFMVAVFGGIHSDNYFAFFVTGRVGQGVGAEILYMIQGNLASTWMGKLAGLIFILPQIGQIGNVFTTPLISTKFGVRASLMVGFIVCLISTFACFYLYCYLKKVSIKSVSIELMENEVITQKNTSIQNKSPDQEQKRSSIEGLDNYSKTHSDKSDKEQQDNPQSLLEMNKVFWLTICLCAINQCLYFPFLDNANQLLKERFCVDYQNTGFYLCLPFISAIIITAFHGQYILHRFQRKTLILICSYFPLIGHGIIYLADNCTSENRDSFWRETLVMFGFIIFGMGLGSYYSVSFPAIGYMVPQKIRGTAYASLCFFQTISMTIVPIISGEIIEMNHMKFQGYANSSLFFICLCVLGIVFSFMIYQYSNDTTFQYDDQDHEEFLEDTNKNINK